MTSTVFFSALLLFSSLSHGMDKLWYQDIGCVLLFNLSEILHRPRRASSPLISVAEMSEHQNIFNPLL